MIISDQQLKLLSHRLASISLDNIGKSIDDIDVVEYENRAADAELFYNHHFKNVIKILIQQQQDFITLKAQDLEQLSFGRGTLNGLILIDEWFQRQISTMREKQKKEEKPEIGEL